MPEPTISERIENDFFKSYALKVYSLVGEERHMCDCNTGWSGFQATGEAQTNSYRNSLEEAGISSWLVLRKMFSQCEPCLSKLLNQ